MNKTMLASGAPEQHIGVVKTKFVTEEQTAPLMEILDLALEDIDKIAGGLVRAAADCSCVNCCSHLKA
jgi:hypothetical protein